MKKEIKSGWAVVVATLLLLIPGIAFAATDDVGATLSKGLFEEEANHNLGAAIQMYRSVIDRFDTDRKLAATAVFRLGECYRKQASTNEAAAQYQRILREFADQAPLVTLSRQNLAASGRTQTTSAPAEQVAEYNQTCAVLENRRKKLKDLLVMFTPSSSFVKDVQTEIDTLENRKDQLEASYPGIIAANPVRGGGESSATVLDIGEISRVEAIIKNSPDLINAPDQSGQTLLQTYAGRGDIGVVKLLLDSGAAANGIRQPDLTPLHFAAGNGHKSVLDLLLSKGAKADAKTEAGVTPLHLAVLKGYELVAKDLIEAGASVNEKVIRDNKRGAESLTFDFRTGQTALHLACLKGYRGLVDQLIAKGADVNAEDGEGATPLTVATRPNNEDMAKTLLAAHADPNAGRSSALNSAARNGNISMLHLFLAHGANPNIGQPSALEVAVQSKRPEAVKELIQFKANPNAKDSKGWPLITGALSDPPTLLALLEGGADPNQKGPNGDFALQNAANFGDDQLVEILLAHGADPNVKDAAQGWTPLHLAALGGKTGKARLLLEKGAKVNAQTSDGQTPLHLAVRNRNPEVAALLLENQADPNLRDNNGETPFDLAKQGPLLPMNSALPSRVPALPGTPAVAGFQAPTPKPVSMVDLLRQHGATEDLPRFDRIEVRRFPNYSSTVFSGSTNGVNRFSLLELLAVYYGFVSAEPTSWHPPGHTYSELSHTLQSSLPFPNLEKIEIRRPNLDGKGWSRVAVSVESILETGDCSKDVWLHWGDQVEIPEADHPLDEQWKGFSVAAFTNLQNCVTRHIEFIIKGQPTNFILKPGWPGGPVENSSEPRFRVPRPFDYWPPRFCIIPALDSSGLLRTSSDLSHVKVTRHNSGTGEDWERVFDCSGSTLANLWLRDGDVVDVPDKP